MIEAFIKKYLVETAGVHPEKLNDPNIKMTDLGLDSLGVVDVLIAVEDKFDIEIHDPMRFRTMSYAEMIVEIECVIKK